MKINLSLLTLAIGFGLCSCEPSAGHPEPEAKPGASSAAIADTQAVKDLEVNFISGWETKNPAVKALYAPDATIATPNSTPARGPTSIASAFDQFAANPNAELDFNNAATVMSGGNLAFSQGTYTARRIDPRTKAIETRNGYYVLIYKKQSDGSWKVIQDVSSSLPKDAGSQATL